MSILKTAALAALCTLSIGLVAPRATSAQRGPAPVQTTAELFSDLAYANRILQNEGVIDAFGHISVRDPQNPQRFYMARNLPPSLVTTKDILHYDMQCNTIDAPQGAGSYGERFIHCGVLRNRPDVNSVIHGHSLSLIKFGVTNTPLRAVFLMGGFLGTAGVPIFDIRTINPKTNMMVTSNAYGDALAKVLGKSPVALMRGHGQTVVGNSISQAVVRAYYAEVNANLQADATTLGTVTYLSPDEAAEAANSVSIARPWEMFKSRVGKVE